jgi:hypothetical protein
MLRARSWYLPSHQEKMKLTSPGAPSLRAFGFVVGAWMSRGAISGERSTRADKGFVVSQKGWGLWRRTKQRGLRSEWVVESALFVGFWSFGYERRPIINVYSQFIWRLGTT